MTVILQILFALSGLLFISSFFIKGANSKIEKELEQLSMDYLQEIYQLKKRMTILEEEILGGETLQTNSMNRKIPQKSIHQVIKNQIISLAQQGLPIEQIARQSSLSVEEVLHVLENAGRNRT